MYRLDGKSVFLTGGATGIGRRIATRLAEEGCDVGIVDINMEEAKHTRSIAELAGRRCAVFKADVGDFDQASAAVDAFLKMFGNIDVLANNAGVISIGLVEENSIGEWRRIFRINLDGVFNFCKAVVPRMRERKSGKLVNTASWLGKTGNAHYGAYCASKFAVIGLTQTLAIELALVGVNVNAVCPGTIVETGMRAIADHRSIEHLYLAHMRVIAHAYDAKRKRKGVRKRVLAAAGND
jgi:NAD(P)-dependent dehydrogenase (short-subunit alcohol dehydrogenase family)